MKVRAGKYKRSDGVMVEVLGEAEESNTNAAMVVYRSLDGNKIWVSSLESFKEEVEVRGIQVQKFQFIV